MRIVVRFLNLCINRKKTMDNIKTIFDALQTDDFGQNFEPKRKPTPSKAIPGSTEKINDLRRRVENGEQMWNDQDRLYYSEDLD